MTPRTVLAIAHSAVLATFRQRWEALQARGHRVTLLAPEAWTEGNRWVPFEKDPRSSLRVIRRQPRLAIWPSPVLRNVATYTPGLERLMRELCPDVVEVFEEPYSLAAFVALRAARRAVPGALRLVFSAQNRLKRYPWPFSWFEGEVLRRADALMPVQEAVTPVLEAKGARGPCCVIPLGIDPARFHPVEPDLSLLPEAAREAPRVGYLGKLQAEKGVLDLVEVLGRLRVPAHLVLAGAGPLRGGLERRVRALGGRLHLLPPLPQTRLPGLYAALDVVCVPSRTTPGWMEQFGRVAVESMACARPTLVSDSGSLPEVVGTGARILPEGEVGAWADAIDQLLGDPEAARELGREGMQVVRTRYTWEAVARRHEEVWAAARTHRDRAVTVEEA